MTVEVEMPDRIATEIARELLVIGREVAALPFLLRATHNQRVEQRRWDDVYWCIFQVKVAEQPVTWYAFEYCSARELGYLHDPFEGMEAEDGFVTVFPVYPVPVSDIEWKRRME